MKISTALTDGRLRICLIGELDHHAAKEAMSHIEDKLSSAMPRDCVIDLEQLTFMDSSGIAVILKTYKRVKSMGGRTSVENAGAQPMRVLEASGIERLIEITMSVKE